MRRRSAWSRCCRARARRRRFPGSDGSAAEATRELVDPEVRRIVDDCYDRAVAQLRGTASSSTRWPQALLEPETLDEEAAYRAAGIDRNGPPPEAPPAKRRRAARRPAS